MTTTERVILIQGDTKSWYEQAIFIVKPDAKNIPTNMVEEAEQIIANYLARNRKPLPANFPITHAHAPIITANETKKRPRKRRADFFINLLMFLGCLAFVLMFVYGVLL
ncbi:MAG: hypothetical protein FWC71_09845 [Defluviitaleaceae bacterium]|nr:hypothetical protein [Defluviitaleaceae bacterium]